MKTATTFLQDAVFSNASAGFGLPGADKSRQFLVKEVILSDGFTFNGPAAAVRFAALEAPLYQRGLVPVWSEETLLGEPVSRRYDAFSNAHRLHAVMPDALVLFTIREQLSLAESMYKEYIRQGGTGSLRSFIGTGSEAMSFTPFLREDFLMYDRAVSHYRSLFGADRVLVLPQELLASDPKDYFCRLGAFTGTHIWHEQRPRVHASLGAATSVIQRTGNHLFSPDPLQANGSRPKQFFERILRRVDRFIPEACNRPLKLRYKAEISARYGTCFTRSNRALSKMMDFDLASLGYR